MFGLKILIFGQKSRKRMLSSKIAVFCDDLKLRIWRSKNSFITMIPKVGSKELSRFGNFYKKSPDSSKVSWKLRLRIPNLGQKCPNWKSLEKCLIWDDFPIIWSFSSILLFLVRKFLNWNVKVKNAAFIWIVDKLLYNYYFYF